MLECNSAVLANVLCSCYSVLQFHTLSMVLVRSIVSCLNTLQVWRHFFCGLFLLSVAFPHCGAGPIYVQIILLQAKLFLTFLWPILLLLHDICGASNFLSTFSCSCYFSEQNSKLQHFLEYSLQSVARQCWPALTTIRYVLFPVWPTAVTW